MSVAAQRKFNPTEDNFIPKPTMIQIPHQGLTDLRQSLIQRGMVVEALQIFRVEFRCLPSEEQCEALTEMTNSLKRFACLGEERLLWEEADLCYQMASVWEVRGEQDTIKVWAKIRAAEELLEEWCKLRKLTEPSDKDALKLSLKIRLLINKLTLEADPLTCFTEGKRLLERMKSCGSGG